MECGSLLPLCASPASCTFSTAVPKSNQEKRRQAAALHAQIWSAGACSRFALRPLPALSRPPCPKATKKSGGKPPHSTLKYGVRELAPALRFASFLRFLDRPAQKQPRKAAASRRTPHSNFGWGN